MKSPAHFAVSRRVLYLTYLAAVGIVVILAVGLLAVASPRSNSSPAASRSAGSTPSTVGGQPGSGTTNSSTTQPVPTSGASTAPAQQPLLPTATTVPSSSGTLAAGTVYLPVNPGSGAGCTAGITEGNQWVKYTVQPGDNLSEIARCFDLNGYQALYQDNIKVIGDNPNLIYPGEVFTIVNGVMTVS